MRAAGRARRGEHLGGGALDRIDRPVAQQVGVEVALRAYARSERGARFGEVGRVVDADDVGAGGGCLLYTSPSPRDRG